MDCCVNPHLDISLGHHFGMDIKKTLSKNLIYFRSNKQLSQAQLATKSGVSQSTVSRVENGEGPAADIDTIGQLAHGLGVSPWQLLSEDGVTVISKSDAQLLAAVKKLANGK